MEIILVMWLVCALIGGFITQSKNKGFGVGLVLGGLLGIIGLIIAACLSSDLPRAPKGMRAVQCPRCNAVQNVENTQPRYQCWQCNQSNTTPGFKQPKPIPVTTAAPKATSQRKVRCFKCEQVQMISGDAERAKCEACGVVMKVTQKGPNAPDSARSSKHS